MKWMDGAILVPGKERNNPEHLSHYGVAETADLMSYKPDLRDEMIEGYRGKIMRSILTGVIFLSTLFGAVHAAPANAQEPPSSEQFPGYTAVDCLPSENAYFYNIGGCRLPLEILDGYTGIGASDINRPIEFIGYNGKSTTIDLKNGGGELYRAEIIHLDGTDYALVPHIGSGQLNILIPIPPEDEPASVAKFVSLPEANPTERADYIFSALKQNNYSDLTNHLKGLPEITDGISPEDAEALEDITSLAVNYTDPEIREAYDSMVKGGIGNQLVGYAPQWNSQLRLLYQLALQNEFKPNDKLPLAIAISNGIWEAMGDDQVDQVLSGDVNTLLEFFRTNTPEVERYSLSPLIALAWRGNDTGSHGIHALSGPQTRYNYRSNPMGIQGYRWNTIDVEKLPIAHNWLITNELTSVPKMEEYLRRHWDYNENWDRQIHVHGEDVPARNFNNPDFQVDQIMTNGFGIGVCEDQMTAIDGFTKSLGIPTLPILTYWEQGDWYGGHTHILYYSNGNWHGYPRQLNIKGNSNTVDAYISRPPVIFSGFLPSDIQPAPPEASVPFPYQNGEVNSGRMFYPLFSMDVNDKVEIFSGFPDANMKQILMY